MSEFDVVLSYGVEDRGWAGELADELTHEGVRVRANSNETAPSQQLRTWMSADAGERSKLILVCSSHYFREEPVGSLLAGFARTESDLLTIHRPLIPVVPPGSPPPALPPGLPALDFCNPDDFDLRLRQLVEALDITPRERGIKRYKNLLPKWKWVGLETPTPEFKERIAALYRLSGFSVGSNGENQGIQFDLLIEKRSVGVHTRTAIDCLESEPSRRQAELLLAKYRLLQNRMPGVGCMLVTERRVSGEIREMLGKGGIAATTYPDILNSLLPLDRYVEGLLADPESARIKKWRGEDWFIRPEAITDSQRERHPALHPISAWLGGKRGNLLALLGDLGTGKTTLAEFLAHELGKAYQADPLRHPAPVLIKLFNVRKAILLESIVTAAFKEHLGEQQMDEFGFSRFEYLARKGRLVLLFDAFDEMAERLQPQVMRENLRELTRLATEGGKVLLTSRTHYFQNRAELEALLGRDAIHLQEFSGEQVRKYLAKARSPDTVEGDWRKIQDIYNLKKLVERPLLLDMVVATMPQARTVSAATLYADYAKIWIDREKSKGRSLDKAVKLRLMIELAWRIWHEEQDKIHAEYLLRAIRELKEYKDLDFGFLTIDDVTEEMRTASFLKRNDDGQYYFADPSFEEYFLARKIYECLKQGRLPEIKAVLRTQRFKEKVIFFLEKLIAENGATVEPFREILKAGYEPEVSENALQILYWSERIRLEMEDEVADPNQLRRAFGDQIPRMASLAGARLKEMTLEAADLSEADFSGADLTGANLNHAQLRHACFRGATLIGARLEDVLAVGADFKEAQLSRAVFRRANLENADFTGVINRETVFENNQGQGKGLSPTGSLRPSNYRPQVQPGASVGFHALTFDADTEYCASSGTDGLISIFRVRDGRLLHTLDAHRGRAVLQFSPSGTLLVSGGVDGMVRLWSVSEGRLLNEHREHAGRVNAVQFSPDGRWVTSGGEDKTPRLWAVDQDRIRYADGFQVDDSPITALDFSFDGRLLASANENGGIRIWDANTGFMVQIMRPPETSAAAVHSLKFSPNGRLLASGGADRLIRLWSIAQGRPLRTLHGHEGEVAALQFSPDGQRLVSGGKRGGVRLWWAGEKERYQFTDALLAYLESTGLQRNIMDRLMPLRSREIIGEEEFLHLLKTTMGKEPAPDWGSQCLEKARVEPLLDFAKKHEDWVGAVRFSNDGASLVSGGTDRQLRSWAVRENLLHMDEARESHAQEKRRAGFRVVRIAPQGSLTVSGGEDGRIYLWPVNENAVAHGFAAHTDAVRTVDVSRDGELIASGSDDCTIRFWAPGESRLMNPFKAHEGSVTSVRFSPRDGLLASGGADGTVGLWLANTGQLSSRLKGHTATVNTVRFSPDGSLLASGGEDNSVFLWNAPKGQPPKLQRKLDGHTDGVQIAHFSPNGAWLASAGRDRSVRLWGVSNGRIRHVMNGHTDSVAALRFFPDGERLASGSDDGAVRIWDVNTGSLQGTLAGHLGRVHSIDISPDGKFLIAAGSAGRLQYWDLAAMKPVLYRYAFNETAWLDLLPDGRYHASEEGKQFLYYTELGRLNSYSADTMKTEFHDPDGVREVLGRLHASNC